MSKENLEETIRNIMNNQLTESKKNRVPGAEDLGTLAADKIRKLFDVEIPTSKGDLVPYKAPDVPSSKGDLATKKPETEVIKDVTPEVSTSKTDVKPQTQTQVRTDTKPQTQVRTGNVEPPRNRPPKGRGESPRRFRSLKFPGGATPGQNISIHQDSVVPVDTYMHMAKEYMPDKFAEETKRTEIENVARPKTDRNKVMARNAEIKNKIIEQNEKRKKIIKDTINLKPETNDHETNEVNEGWKTKLAGAAGLGLGLSHGSNVEKQLQKAGIQNPESQRTNFDTFLDAASLIPGIGSLASGWSAVRSFKRGDYGDAALDALGVIPGASYLTKGLKWGGRAAKGAGIMSKLTGLGTDAQRIGGKTLIKPDTINRASKLGKAIDKTSDVADAVATPGNLFQLGQAGEPVAKPIAGAVKDVAVDRYNKYKQNNSNKPGS